MEHVEGSLSDLLLVLLAAIVAVPLLHRLRASPVIGYLAAGVVIGPHGSGLVPRGAIAGTLSELGVIFLLFVVGLDLPWRRLRALVRLVFGLGLAQVAVTGTLVGGAAAALGAGAPAALVIGGSLAVSSTATALQVLAERRELATRAGRAALGILLFQDLFVVPLLVLVPLLGAETTRLPAALALAGAKAAAALGLVIVAERFLMRPAYRAVAATRNADIFASMNLLVVLGAAWLVSRLGMPTALGAILAGFALAGTEYRHQVEADILPFRGLFLGLFFVTVGMSIDTRVVAAAAPQVVALTLALFLAKAAIAAALCRLFGLPPDAAMRVGILLGQGGEFAFVILALAQGEGLLSPATADMLAAAVALGIALTPAAAAAAAPLTQRLALRLSDETAILAGEAADLSGHVIVAGHGRVGRIVTRTLRLSETPHVAIDLDLRHVQEGRADGLPLFFGDASRTEVLRAAGLERAAGVVVTLDRPEATERIVATLRRAAPDLPVVARSRDGKHAAALQRVGATTVVQEAVEPALQLAGAILRLTGAEEVDETLDLARQHPAP